MHQFRNILCLIGDKADNAAALQRAAALARRNQARLCVAAIGESIPGRSDEAEKLRGALSRMRREQLESLTALCRELPGFETLLLEGTPFLEAIRQVRRGGHDLLIKTAENPDWTHHLFGSDDMHLLRKCPCPVWLLKPPADRPFRHILAAVDIDSEAQPDAEGRAAQAAMNRRIFELASTLARDEGAQLHLAHAWEAIGETVSQSSFFPLAEDKLERYVRSVERSRRADLDGYLQQMRAALGEEAWQQLKPRSHLVKGWARTAIAELAADLQVDLVVMGTIGRTGIPGFLIGNTAETIFRQLDCGALAIKPDGFVTPVR